jgi:hypothetical protein
MPSELVRSAPIPPRPPAFATVAARPGDTRLSIHHLRHLPIFQFSSDPVCLAELPAIGAWRIGTGTPKTFVQPLRSLGKLMDGTPSTSSTSFCTAILIDTASYSFGERAPQRLVSWRSRERDLGPFSGRPFEKIQGRIKTNSYS